MAIRKLTKIARKAEQAAFAVFEDDNGVREEVRIQLKDYKGVGQNMMVKLLRPGKTLVGGFTRFDYETPTGLLGEGEYGDDGVERLTGEPVYQVKADGVPFVVPVGKIVAHEMEDTDALVAKRMEVAKDINEKQRK